MSRYRPDDQEEPSSMGFPPRQQQFQQGFAPEPAVFGQYRPQDTSTRHLPLPFASSYDYVSSPPLPLSGWVPALPPPRPFGYHPPLGPLPPPVTSRHGYLPPTNPAINDEPEVIDLENPPARLQDFANRAVIQMFERHPEQFNGPIDPTKLPYPGHESAVLALHYLSTSPLPTAEPPGPPQAQSFQDYDPLWMFNEGRDASEMTASRRQKPFIQKKIDELFLRGIIKIGDRLVLQVDNDNFRGEATFLLTDKWDRARNSANTLKKCPVLTFTMEGTNIREDLICPGIGSLTTFLTDRNIVSKVNTRKDIHLFRGQADLGSLDYVFQTYQYWERLNDEETMRTGVQWRPKRRARARKQPAKQVEVQVEQELKQEQAESYGMETGEHDAEQGWRNESGDMDGTQAGRDITNMGDIAMISGPPEERHHAEYEDLSTREYDDLPVKRQRYHW